jgi:hypothetical protein
MKIKINMLILTVMILSSVIITGCSITGNVLLKDETHCEKQSECACGIHHIKGECFVGNKEFVNVTDDCSDFCNGLRGGLTTKCINNACEITPE